MEFPNRVTFKRVRDQLSLDDPEEVDDILRRLAAAVILSAMRDAAGRSKISDVQMHDARVWLLDDETELWFTLAGVQRKDILAWFEAGCKITRQHKLGNIKGPCKKKIFPLYELKVEPRGNKPLIDPDLGPEY